MTAPALFQPAKRVRASERALRIALRVVQDTGLSVEKLCITGGQIEIHCGRVDAEKPSPDHGGPEDW
ncbi:hypothetical protein QO002_002130 [Pararhizobium capsulatum DSM 1112]|uniref:Transposase n=1 Tax=Pararhizobium capsulatum DSM 1112 TaxID=1121113 RepID=A0ABU0BP15_9HYPH|nr:hypothetical protein [Pararhizobium capsulatum DSM 1112]